MDERSFPFGVELGSRVMTEQPFTVSSRQLGATAVVIPEGELDLAGVGRFEDAVDSAVTDGADRVVIDLRNLTFMDSSGLRSMVMIDARAESDGFAFALIAGPEAVHRV